MRAPDFWKARGFISTLLLPASLLYAFAGHLRRIFTKPVKVSAPVICIGNLSAGGTGKTPITLSIGKMLSEAGHTPHIITRGYGGNQRGPLQVRPDHHQATEVGDEPLMLAQSLPTWVSRDRAQGAKAAINAGADILLLDDGFQNPTLIKDLSLIVVDGTLGFANGRIIPAGPLRESVQVGIKRADAIILMGNPSDNICPELSTFLEGITVLPAHVEPKVLNEQISVTNKSIFAFAAIGYPQKFYTTLEQFGAKLVGTRDFPDHHAYSRSDLLDVIKSATAAGAELIYTTEKDYTKIPDDLRDKINSLPIQAVWDNPNTLMKLINKTLGLK